MRRLIGERIADLRRAAGITQYPRGDRLDRAQGWVRQVECGKRALAIPQAWTLARVLGVNADGLVGEPRTLSERTMIDIFHVWPPAP